MERNGYFHRGAAHALRPACPADAARSLV